MKTQKNQQFPHQRLILTAFGLLIFFWSGSMSVAAQKSKLNYFLETMEARELLEDLSRLTQEGGSLAHFSWKVLRSEDLESEWYDERFSTCERVTGNNLVQYLSRNLNKAETDSGLSSKFSVFSRKKIFQNLHEKLNSSPLFHCQSREKHYYAMSFLDLFWDPIDHKAILFRRGYEN
jgi:hypothetical protein